MVQRGVDCPAGNNFIGRFAADPFRLAALATHPLNRGGQGALRDSLLRHQCCMMESKSLLPLEGGVAAGDGG